MNPTWVYLSRVSLYCFGSSRRKFSNYWLERAERSGHITEIANYGYPISTIVSSPDVTAANILLRNLN